MKTQQHNSNCTAPAIISACLWLATTACAASFTDAKIPVVCNVVAAPLAAADALRADVKAQMQNRVRWTESVRWMSAQGVDTFVEVGTGSVLGGLVKRILEGVTTLPLGNPQDFDALK